jgi:small subunit ribosomal protein S6
VNRNYEIAYIADPDLDEEALTSLEETVKSWIETAEGKTTNVERWGKRKLAYSIRKRSEGYYFILETEMPPQAGRAIERDLGLNEQVLRYLLTSRDQS